MPPSESTKTAERIQRNLDRAKALVGALSLDVDVAGAIVELDGREVGTSPLGRALYVPPGEHKLTLRKGGYAPLELTETLAAINGGNPDSNVCGAGSAHPKECAAIQDLHDSRSALQTGAIVGYSVGAAALIGSLMTRSARDLFLAAALAT